MPPTIVRADFTDARLAAFLQAHLEETEPTAPVESRHALDRTALMVPHIRVWVAVDGEELVATAALAALDPGRDSGHEELKSMRTAPSRRGQGVASAMLEHLLANARARGVARVSLETGSMDFFAPAWSLYTKAGFVPCPPFGSYVEDPYSVFMTQSLIS